MKRFFWLCVTLIILLVFTGCGRSSTGKYKDGVYNGIAQGYGGEIEVQVTINGGKITDIQIVREQETPGISDTAKVQTIERIIQKGSTDIDLVSGATATSKGIRDAVENALQQGK
ncbi:FMN-binding protein [Anaerobranca gottschalkii]|uniref:FMN-binding domain-containing protein n=1 Tax=Anaerobranca gottschalkii DSM 13577 TaxID=1120990 RepID=A0A1I0CNF5_9FIRM|nr:FMN-binding protein [Anaerobranca gottschalkii]SET21199.1 FMN-binding domain-containing protein [Anaerobranca gottschalkii DSM 13577]